MKLSRIEKNAYARGYQRGADRWPEHRPPIPPSPVIGDMVRALQSLRDAIDGELAKFDPNDPLNVAMTPFIDRADDALTALSRWLRTGHAEQVPDAARLGGDAEADRAK